MIARNVAQNVAEIDVMKSCWKNTLAETTATKVERRQRGLRSWRWGSKSLPLTLHQSISVFHTGGTPHLVYLVVRMEDTRWIKLLDLLKAVTHQTCRWIHKSNLSENSSRDQLIEVGAGRGNHPLGIEKWTKGTWRLARVNKKGRSKCKTKRKLFWEANCKKKQFKGRTLKKRERMWRVKKSMKKTKLQRWRFMRKNRKKKQKTR